MNETLILMLAWIAGALLGVFFFGGLWWTIRKGISSTRPAFWFFGSLLLRMCVILVGFYVVSRGHWNRLLTCLLGFIMARTMITWLTRTPLNIQTRPAEEASHAPWP